MNKKRISEEFRKLWIELGLKYGVLYMNGFDELGKELLKWFEEKYYSLGE